MALSRVRPGDLITADTYNSLVDEIDRLSRKVDELGSNPSGGDPIIDDVLFTGTLREGDPVQIIGKNFRYSAGAQLVTFDDVQVVAFRPGSDDSQLLVNVPSMALPAEGRNVKLRVANGFGNDTQTLFILPVNLATGDDVLDVLWSGQIPATPQAGQELALTYTLRSRAAAPLNVDVTPTLSGGGVSWQNVDVQVMNAGGTESFPNGRIPLPALGSVPFRVRVVVPAAANGSMFFAVQARSGAMFGGDTRPVPLGVTGTPPDSTITFTAVEKQVLTAAGIPTTTGGAIDLGASTIQLRSGFLGKVVLRGEFTQQGAYTIETKTTGGWQQSTDGGVSFLAADATTTRPIAINASDFVGGRAGRNTDIFVKGSSSSQPGTLSLRIFRTGGTGDQRKSFSLALAS